MIWYVGIDRFNERLSVKAEIEPLAKVRPKQKQTLTFCRCRPDLLGTLDTDVFCRPFYSGEPVNPLHQSERFCAKRDNNQKILFLYSLFWFAQFCTESLFVKNFT